MNIATLSGGIMSFYTAYLSIQKYGKENVLLYFNDTKWEHPDLYRFLGDIKTYLKKDIYFDTDGRNPEQVFFDEHFLGCNRVPLCSRVLKAERLQKFYKNNDNLIFGIGIEEQKRRERIIAAYQVVYAKTQKFCTLEFPLIDKQIPKYEIEKWFEETGIKKPELYSLGFEHNNCSGGCVRQGKKQWLKLLQTLPDVYREREEMEERFRERFRECSIMKDITLKQFRQNIESDIKYFESLYENELFECECIGVCRFVA
jgi:3'-phosphoadenosine 5'-phosphosulfate sulfotransferase (PAPS reductase)/FAD synthetase